MLPLELVVEHEHEVFRVSGRDREPRRQRDGG